MARIRTIKPEFFRHEGLQDLEAANPGSFVMLVFAGLWGHCDKLGRFEWKPRTLKLDILPFLDFDMPRTLALLSRAGFVRQYQAEGKEYGEIPGFEVHQRISGKESQEPEKHPEPEEYITETTGEEQGKQQGSNREATGIAGREGKGREKEGKGKWNGDMSASADVSAVFDHWRATMNHPRASLDEKRRKLITSRLKNGYTADDLCNAITGYSMSAWHMGDNERGQHFDGLDLILRDGAHVDAGLAYLREPPRRRPTSAGAEKFDPGRYMNEPDYRERWNQRQQQQQGGGDGRVIEHE